MSATQPNSVVRILTVFLILFSFLLVLSFPKNSEAYTYQDVTNWIEANPLTNPTDCMYFIKAISDENGEGYEVWKRCSKQTRAVLNYYGEGTTKSEWSYTTGTCDGLSNKLCAWTCDGAAGYIPAASGVAYSAETRYIDIIYCDGTTEFGYQSSGALPKLLLMDTNCFIYEERPYSCTDSDTLVITFGLVDECLDSLGALVPCASNCEDPVDKTTNNVVEICGNNIDDDCNGYIDEDNGIDADGDGYTSCQGDTNDNDPGNNPGNQGGCGGGSDMGSRCNFASGNLFQEQSLASAGMNLSYNSNEFFGGDLGPKWSHSYSIKLIERADGSIILDSPSGKQMIFELNGGLYYPQGKTGLKHSTIDKTASEYILTTQNTSYYFDLGGLITSYYDKNGNATTFLYLDGELVSVLDPTGRKTSIAHDLEGRIIGVTSPHGKVFALGYDTDGMLSSVTNPDGGVWAYTYDADGRMITKTNPRGGVYTYTYTTEGRLAFSKDPLLVTKTISYDTATSIATVTERDGGVWTHAYDPVLNVATLVTDPYGKINQYDYDSSHNLRFWQATGFRFNDYTYDAEGNLLTDSDAYRSITSYTYNARGQVLTITHPDATSITYTYDAFGNLTSHLDEVGALTQYAYDSAGNLITITNALSNVTIMAYDASNNLVSTIDPTGVETTFTYFVNSRNIETITSVATGAVTAFTYDDMDRVLTITDALSGVTTYGYDLMGNRTSVIDANGKLTSYAYDDNNNLTSVTDAMNGVTSYTYDAGGKNLTSVEDANRNTTTFTHDYLGRVLTETDPLGAVKTYTYGYNTLREPSTKTDAMGVTISYGHDSLNRLVSKSTGESFTYDARSRMLTGTNSANTFAYTYDGVGRVLTATDALTSNTINNLYDTVGNRTSRTVASEPAFDATYTYDEANRPTTTTTPAGDFITTYDTAGRKVQLDNPGSTTTAYEYDTLNRLTLLEHKRGRPLDPKAAYTYDAVGNRTSKTTLDYTQSYTYDNVYRLLTVSMDGAQTEKYYYDYVGNRARLVTDAYIISYLYSRGNILTDTLYNTGQSITVYHNANGNMTRQSGSSPSGAVYKTLAYDTQNRITTASNTVMGINKRNQFTYGPLGRRMNKRYYDANVLQYEHNYLYDGEDVIGVYDAATGTLLKSYTHGAGIDEIWAETDHTTGVTSYFHSDGLGSIMSTTNSNGQIQETYDYTVFGESIGADTPSHYGFTGRELDETGLYYYRARFYMPELGRFTSKDPIGFAGGDVNLYSYVGQNPVNYTDPWGLFGCVTTVDCAIREAIRRGDIDELLAIMDVKGVSFPTRTKLLKQCKTNKDKLLKTETRLPVDPIHVEKAQPPKTKVGIVMQFLRVFLSFF